MGRMLGLARSFYVYVDVVGVICECVILLWLEIYSFIIIAKHNIYPFCCGNIVLFQDYSLR